MSHVIVTMNFKEYIHKTCAESSIHGLPYLVNRELHWSERVFWGFMVILATFFSIRLCLNQWIRFRDSPIVYALEIAKYKLDYPFPGVTACTSYEDPEVNAQLVEKLWGYNNETFDYYMQFLSTVNVLRADTLESLKPYANDNSVKNVDFLELLLNLRKDEIRVDSVVPLAPAILEMGLCFTASRMVNYTSPYKEVKDLPIVTTVYCNIFNVCEKAVLPTTLDNRQMSLYIHKVDDIASLAIHDTLRYRPPPMVQSIVIDLEMQSIAAEDSVRDLPVAYRKCLYTDESNLKYFETYTVTFCHIECRIDAALRLCNCKPYFYAVAPNAPLCNLKGLLCLARKAWFPSNHCDCHPTCEDYMYYTTQKVYKEMQGPVMFSFSAIVNIQTPDMSMKRRVVFSTDQLFVSFGGSIGFFIGMSLVSVFGLIYVLLECIGTNLKSYCERRKRRQIKPDILETI